MLKERKFNISGIGMFLLAATLAIPDTGPSIAGNIDINVITGNISNTALGSGSVADIEIGSVLSGNINGVVKIVVKTGDIVNAAEGTDSLARVRIGNIGQ